MRMKFTDHPRLRAASDAAARTLVATFPGSAYVAEREGDDLRVYLISDEPIASVITSQDGGRKVAFDRATYAKNLEHRERIEDLNAANKAAWPARTA